jgi:hypothetical protein
MKTYTVIVVLLLSVLTGLFILFKSTQTNSSDPLGNTLTTENIYDVPQRPAFDSAHIPHNIYSTICMVGHPMFVSNWSLDPDTRFLLFKGPFRDVANPNSRVYPYMYRAIKSLDSDTYTTQLLLDSIDEYQDDIVTADLEQFLIPRYPRSWII